MNRGIFLVLITMLVTTSLLANERVSLQTIRMELYERGYLKDQKFTVDGAQVPEEMISLKSESIQVGDSFKYGEVNVTKSISASSTVNGRTLSSISYRLSEDASCGSGQSFMKSGESLVSKLRHDNELVLGRLHLTHQKIAHPLLLGKIIAKPGIRRNDVGRFTYNGQSYRVKRYDYLCGSMQSPFGEGLSMTNGAMIIFENEASGEKLEMASLVPEFIYLYGFYGSTRGSLSPKTIAKFFGL